ncbi:glycine zipper family protein [Candidatus Methylospira mobilis]|uniref:Glycine zipper family protein n=1 Tax=Candidatus Methylospira mobilis TaxID=1808979 RepID=A0A5Q0BI66_9GAMM|nr:glycine zipper family protein [Candidatus Methylospira mobilis]QFY42812.1 glycine zipper family protein [Candidatus Methylospira mobilis]WNV03705.1 hypothetical protein RP726_14815 [Candidatus Methylospira mobilis]
MTDSLKRIILTAPLILTACATVPSGPTILALPGTGKNFEQFNGDDTVCRHFALLQAQGASPRQAAASSGLTGNDNDIGPVAPRETGNTDTSSAARQNNYDIAYIHCMYAKGHRVPVQGHLIYEDKQEAYAPPPPPVENTQ